MGALMADTMLAAFEDLLAVGAGVTTVLAPDATTRAVALVMHSCRLRNNRGHHSNDSISAIVTGQVDGTVGDSTWVRG
jgi:hypothetical protein